MRKVATAVGARPQFIKAGAVSRALDRRNLACDTPCITLREETEWVEIAREGWNILAGASKERILGAFESIISWDCRYSPLMDSRILHDTQNTPTVTVTVIRQKRLSR